MPPCQAFPTRFDFSGVRRWSGPRISSAVFLRVTWSLNSIMLLYCVGQKLSNTTIEDGDARADKVKANGIVKWVLRPVHVSGPDHVSLL